MSEPHLVPFEPESWLESFAKVVKYKEEHGNCIVPRRWRRDPALGEWVRFQRRQFRKRQLNRRNHNMTDDRIRKLEAIGFEWSRGTAAQPPYIRLYEQNKEIANQGGILPLASSEVVDETATMHTSEVPTDVSQISVLDGEEQGKAEEIAAVVEEQLKTPEDEVHHQQVHHPHEQEHHQQEHHQQEHQEHFGEYPQGFDEHNLHHPHFEREYEHVHVSEQIQEQEQEQIEEQVHHQEHVQVHHQEHVQEHVQVHHQEHVQEPMQEHIQEEGQQHQQMLHEEQVQQHEQMVHETEEEHNQAAINETYV
mmetsp:Transcript_16113/g.23579  ORF Transcript_16113/g.23579 Transcript_16113/m.23579 type:complete len:307 (-) Transcript_16113:161-1081(-)